MRMIMRTYNLMTARRLNITIDARTERLLSGLANVSEYIRSTVEYRRARYLAAIDVIRARQWSFDEAHVACEVLQSQLLVDAGSTYLSERVANSVAEVLAGVAMPPIEPAERWTQLCEAVRADNILAGAIVDLTFEFDANNRLFREDLARGLPHASKE